MRFALGVATGVAAAWAALAIWQRLPQPMGDSYDGRCICGCDDVGQIAYHGRTRPAFDPEAHTGNGLFIGA